MTAVAASRFNSRSRVGSDPPSARLFGSFTSFNSRSRVGSDTHDQTARFATHCFNSRSRVGSDLDAVDGCRLDGVSIRAPAWGATLIAFLLLAETPPFQFALPRGERRGYAPSPACPRRFNSRSRVGSDCAIVIDESQMIKFQFALPRGERRADSARRCRCGSFNSRSRVGSDADPARWWGNVEVSIRAPAWGATLLRYSSANPHRFNSRSRVGSDRRGDAVKGA